VVKPAQVDDFTEIFKKFKLLHKNIKKDNRDHGLLIALINNEKEKQKKRRNPQQLFIK